MTSNRLSFALVEIDKNYSLTRPQPQPGSFSQRQVKAEERERAWERGWLHSFGFYDLTMSHENDLFQARSPKETGGEGGRGQENPENKSQNSFTDLCKLV